MNPLHRIIDANLNRAREALRTLEDIARFGVDHAALTERLKSARHALRSVIDTTGLDALLLSLSRDTPGDVGTQVTTPSETARRTLADIAAAAASRLGEALRSLEESFKVLAPAAASRIEQLRYETYDHARSLVALLPSGKARQWRLCVLISERLCVHHPWHRVAELAVDGGADAIQLREKDLEGGELLSRAVRLVDIAADRAAVIINDRPDVALACGATGVHLGQTDLPIQAVRALTGWRLAIGISTSRIDQALAAAEAGADYLGCGPMFPTSTKTKDVIAGPTYLRQILDHPRLAHLPHLAIGGITPNNIAALTGCRGVAVSRAVCASPHPADTCRALLQGLNA